MSATLAEGELDHKQIMQLVRHVMEYKGHVGYDVSDPTTLYRMCVSGYMDALALQAAIDLDNAKLKGADKVRLTYLHNITLRLGHTPTADDIVAELSRWTPLPDFATGLIRKDLERMSG